VDVKAFLSIQDFNGINIYRRIVFSYWQISFFMVGRFMGGLWAVQGFNVEEREEQNMKACDENSGRLLAECIFMGGSNYLWADQIFYGQMQYP
jgi:hypothetical protein